MNSNEQDERLTAASHQPESLIQFFRESPLVGADLDLERDNDAGPEIRLDANE